MSSRPRRRYTAPCSGYKDCGVRHAGGGADSSGPAALSLDDRLPTRRPDCAQPARARVLSRSEERGRGNGRDGHLDRRRMALPRRDARPLLAACRGVGNERPQRPIPRALALRAAIAERRPPPGLIHHSDRGSPYASDHYRAELERFGIIASMSRKGDCWDNAVAETFSTVKTRPSAPRPRVSRGSERGPRGIPHSVLQHREKAFASQLQITHSIRIELQPRFSCCIETMSAGWGQAHGILHGVSVNDSHSPHRSGVLVHLAFPS